MGEASFSNSMCFRLIFLITAFLQADGYFHSRLGQCIFSSPDLSDMVFIDSTSFNKVVITEFNSTVGKFVGYSAYGMYNAEFWNNDTNFLLREREQIDKFCKFNAKIMYSAILEKAVPPKIKLSLVKKSSDGHPAVLMCSAYDFYPEHIRVSWLRDGKEETTDVTSTEEMPDGDWYYQIHSQLEYTPTSGEKIQCVVEHASANNPIITDWDPSLLETEKNKILTGAFGLALGIIMVAGSVYYRKKSEGRVLVPH